MRIPLFLALATGLVWPGVPAHARDVRRLQPTTQWVLDYADDSCRLARKFGTGEDAVTLVMEQFAPGDWFKVSLIGETVEPRSPYPPIEADLRFGPNEAKDEVTAVTGTVGEDRALFLDGMRRLSPLSDAEEKARREAERRHLPFEPPPLGEAREMAVTTLELSKVLKADLVLDTGPMDKPMAALRHCSWDTVRSWGLDVDQQKALSRKVVAKRSPASWFSSDDYPRDMLRGGFEANVNFRVMVDEQGNPTSCHIQASTRPKEFDDLVCATIMKRARFEPALDSQGNAVRSYWRQSVSYRIRS